MFFLNENEKVETDIYVNELDPIIDEINLIDIRERFEFKSGTIKGAKNIPMGEILNTPEAFMNKEDTYYLLCKSGRRSDDACRVLRREGYKVINVEGGVVNYEGDYFI